MANILKKTVVIGLGGTGMHSVLHMKKKLLDTYGEIPPLFKFLVIDTTDKDQLESDDRVIQLEPGEFLKLEVREPGVLMSTSREIKEWVPDNVPKFALSAGAKQVRSLGRLAVFANGKELDSKISLLIGSIRDYRIPRVVNYGVLSDNIVVNIVCSLSGGTGSGCYLDVATIVRNMLKEKDKLIGYFLMPDIFVGKPATVNVEPNAYGALKEINYFFDNGKMRYQLAGMTRTLDGLLFNAAYLVNKTNSQGVEYNSLPDLQEFLGLGMFMQSTTTGKGAADILDNLEAQMVQNRWYGKPTVFSSFGISELVYPGDWYADLYARKIALQTLQSVFLGGDLETVGQVVDDFVRISGLREHEADEVIDAILDPTDVPGFPIPKEPKKDSLAAVFARREPYIADVRRTCRDEGLKALSRLKTDKTGQITAKLKEFLNVPKGLEVARGFISCLNGRLSEYREEMGTEREAHEQRRDDLNSRYSAVEAEAVKEGNAFFSATKKTEAVLKRYKQLVEREASLVIEVERRERAIDLFAHLIAETNGWLDNLNRFSSYCGTLVGELSREIEHRQSAKRDIRPFSYELKPANLTNYQPKAEPHDFLAWLRDERKLSALDLGDKRIAEVKEVLFAYGAADKVVKEILSLGVDDVLRQLSKDEQLRHVKQLDNMAAPLWQYNQGLMAGEKHPENIYLFGVADSGNTVCEPETIKSAIASPFPPSVVTTGDRRRIVCFKIEACVPAFVVDNVPRYREKYSESRRPFSYHLHRDWDHELPDLFPASEESETRKYWSLALAEPFNLIVRKGEFYYAKSEKKGQRTAGNLVRLAQGRREAMKAFLDDPDLIEELRESIDDILSRLGYQKVTEALRQYGQDLEAKAGKQTEEVRLQVENELRDIEAFATSMALL